MNMKLKEKTIVSMLIHGFILITVIFSTCFGVVNGPGAGQVGGNMTGWNYFMPYTMDSNVFYGLISVFVIVEDAQILLEEKDCLSDWLYRLQYAGCCCLLMTFLIVLIFLAPMQMINGRDFLNLFSDEMLYYHLLNPIGACFSFIFFTDFKFTKKDNLLAMVPTILYGIIYTSMFLLKKWPDFYGFTFGGHYWLIPIDVIVIFSVCYLLGKLLRVLNKKVSDNN